MVLSLDRILTISATEYCKKKRVDLTDYDLVRVEVSQLSNYMPVNFGFGPKIPNEVNNKLLKGLAEEAPENTEAIIEYRGVIGSDSSMIYKAIGFALIKRE